MVFSHGFNFDFVNTSQFLVNWCYLSLTRSWLMPASIDCKQR